MNSGLYYSHYDHRFPSFDLIHHSPELSKLNGGSKVWRQFLRVRYFFYTSPYLSMGFSFLATIFLVLVVTFLVQCKHWRDVALEKEKTPPLLKYPSVTDSGFEASTATWKRRSDSRSVNECRSMPILSDYAGSYAATKTPSPTRGIQHPDTIAESAPKPIRFTSPSTIEFDSRFYQDFEPMKCLGESKWHL